MPPLPRSTILGCFAIGVACTLTFPGLGGMILAPIAAVLFAILFG